MSEGEPVPDDTSGTHVDEHDASSHSVALEATMMADTTKTEPARMGRPSELTGGLADLAEAMGGIEALSRAIGVTARTIQRWNKGELNPSAPVRMLLETLAKQHKVEAPFERKEIPEVVLRAGERDLLLLVAGAPKGKIKREALEKKLAKKMGGFGETTFVNYLGVVARAELVERFDVDGEFEEIAITKKGRALARTLK